MSLEFDAEWVAGPPGSHPEEFAALARLRVVLADSTLTRNMDRVRGMTRERLNVAMAPLAEGLATSWWPLLYEPRRAAASRDVDADFEGRHRLDALVAGFVFPPLRVASMGAESVLVEGLAQDAADRAISRLELIPGTVGRPVEVAREDVEGALAEVVVGTLSRLGGSSAGARLADAWSRVSASLADLGERAFCESAGRLGLDPYDPEVPDLARLADGLSDRLFADVCEAALPEEVSEAARFAQEQVMRLPGGQVVDLGALGAPPSPDLSRQAWRDGYEAARLARERLTGSQDDLASADVASRWLPPTSAGHIEVRDWQPVEGLARRIDARARVVVAGRSDAQRRFRVARSAYIAWSAPPGQDFALTVARTRVQQASRAFAAEWLAPAALLRSHAAGRRGLSQDDVEELAARQGCDPQVIRDQAYNHGIGLR